MIQIQGGWDPRRILGRRQRRGLLALGLVLAALALSAAVAELGLALFWPQRPDNDRLFVSDPTLGWKLRPDHAATVVIPMQWRRRIHTNSAGFRGPELPGAGAGRRVAVLGDSFTANLQVEDDDVFTVRAERRLARERIRLLNLGVPGYGQVQELLLLERVLARVRPDAVVVVLYTGNDFDDNHGTEDFAHHYPRPRAALDAAGRLEIVGMHAASLEPQPPAREARRCSHLSGLVRSTHLYALAYRSIIARWRFGNRRLETLAAHRFRPDLRLARQSLDAWDRRVVELEMKLLDRIAERCRDAKVPLGFVVAPTLWQVYPDRWSWLLDQFGLDRAAYRADRTDELVVEHCRARGYRVLDLLPALRAAGRRDRDLYYLADEHWTASGNQVVATEVADFVQRLIQGAGPPRARVVGIGPPG